MKISRNKLYNVIGYAVCGTVACVMFIGYYYTGSIVYYRITVAMLVMMIINAMLQIFHYDSKPHFNNSTLYEDTYLYRHPKADDSLPNEYKDTIHSGQTTVPSGLLEAENLDKKTKNE